MPKLVNDIYLASTDTQLYCTVRYSGGKIDETHFFETLKDLQDSLDEQSSERERPEIHSMSADFIYDLGKDFDDLTVLEDEDIEALGKYFDQASQRV